LLRKHKNHYEKKLTISVENFLADITPQERVQIEQEKKVLQSGGSSQKKVGGTWFDPNKIGTNL